MCRSRRELSNKYLLATCGFDTAENEPCKVCPLYAYRSPRFLDDLGKHDKNKDDKIVDSPEVEADLAHVKEAQQNMAKDEQEERKLELRQPKKLRELGRRKYLQERRESDDE